MLAPMASARLSFRGFGQADFDAYAAFWASAASRFVGGPLARDDAWRRMAMYAGHALLRGYGIWALEETATGRFVGQAGLWNPEGWPEPEIHWLLLAEAQGRGLATEAALRIRDHARDDLGWTRLVSCIDPANLASVRVAGRLGAVAEGEARAGERRFVVWRHRMA